MYMADSLPPLLPLLPLFPLIHLLGTLLAVIGSVHLVSRLLVNWPFVPLFSPCGPQPKVPTPRGFPDPNMHLIRTTLRTQPQRSLTVKMIFDNVVFIVFILVGLGWVICQGQSKEWLYTFRHFFLYRFGGFSPFPRQIYDIGPVHFHVSVRQLYNTFKRI